MKKIILKKQNKKKGGELMRIITIVYYAICIAYNMIKLISENI